MTELDHCGVRLRLIPGYDDAYFAGSDGHVYSIKKGIPRRLREQAPKKWRGLRSVNLYSADHRYDRVMPSGRVVSTVAPQPKYVHRLIAAAWLPPQPSPRHEIDHRDENRANNRPDNLRWVTKRQNALAFRANHPEFQVGSNNAFSILTEREIPPMRALQGVKGAGEVAALFGVSAWTVRSVWGRKTWKHVP